MNLVSFALRRPITILVLAIAVMMTGFLAIERMPRDVFPNLGVPVLYVAQPYGGMDPAQMEGFIVNYYEYHFLYITGIEHVESKSIQGVGLIKLQFHPGTNMAQATAETVGYVDRARAFMPTGTVPPFVMRFDGGGVPVGDLVFSSKTKTVAELQDAALFKVRPLFATLPGVSAPPPFGSSQRTILVRADPGKLRAYNMSPDEVVRALGAGNTVSPSGNVRIGDLWPMVPVNSVVGNIKDLSNIPIRSQGTQTIFIRDVGSVEDGADIQTGYALVDGQRTVYIPVTKRADASTLAVVQAVKANSPRFQSVLPEDIKVSYQFDQPPYVTRAIQGLFFEGALGVVSARWPSRLSRPDCRQAAISKRSSLQSRESRAPVTPLLRKEMCELATGSSLWVLLMLLSPLVGYSFIQAVALYAEASRPALSIPELARQLSPFDGILVPTLGGFYLAITLLFPFITIRLIAAEKASGGLKLLVQLPYRLTDLAAAKFAALIAAWLIALIPGLSALIWWQLLGGHVDMRETATLILGHLLYALLI